MCVYWVILVFWACLFNCIPSNASVFPQCSDIYWPSHVAGTDPVGINRQFNEFGGQSSLVGCSLQVCSDIDLGMVFPLRTELGRNLNMTPRCANFLAWSLTARPAINHFAPHVVVNWSRQGGNIEKELSGIHRNLIVSGLEKHSTSEQSITCLGKSGAGQGAQTTKRIPVITDSVCPFIGDGLYINFPFLFSSVANGFSSQRGIVPTRDGVGEGTRETDTTSRGEYKLMIESRNLTFEVFWFSGIEIYSPTVGSHHKLIFREVENNDRPRIDLGKCWIAYKDEKYEHFFSHVSISSREASTLGFFNDSNEKIPVCSGCTVLISQDAHMWYEIIAIQGVLESFTHDPSISLPWPE